MILHARPHMSANTRKVGAEPGAQTQKNVQKLKYIKSLPQIKKMRKDSLRGEGLIVFPYSLNSVARSGHKNK